MVQKRSKMRSRWTPEATLVPRSFLKGCFVAPGVLFEPIWFILVSSLDPKIILLGVWILCIFRDMCFLSPLERFGVDVGVISVSKE